MSMAVCMCVSVSLLYKLEYVCKRLGDVKGMVGRVDLLLLTLQRKSSPCHPNGALTEDFVPNTPFF